MVRFVKKREEAKRNKVGGSEEAERREKEEFI